MNIWAIANQKGGVGKTTTTVSLGGHLSSKGKKTLLVDLDPHGSLTSYFGYDPDNVNVSSYHLFRDKDTLVTSMIVRTKFEHLHLLPASSALATLDRQLGTQEGKGLTIMRALMQLTGQFDHVLIDCPPMLGVLMVNALAACNTLIIPVQTEFLALKGLERMLHTLAMIMKARKRPLPFLIVPTFYDKRTRASVQTLDVLHQRYQDHLWDLVIPVDTLFREASRQGVPISMLATESRGSMAYQTLLDTLDSLQVSEAFCAI